MSSKYFLFLLVNFNCFNSLIPLQLKESKPNTANLTLKLEKQDLPETLTASFVLTAESEDGLKVPSAHNLFVGYKGDSEADCYFEVVEIKQGSNSLIEPTADYQYLGKKEETLTLKRKESINYVFNLCRFYLLDPAKKYKFRLVFRLSNYNDGFKDLTTAWINTR